MKLWDFSTEDIGVDLGTRNIIFTIKNNGIELKEKSIVAVNQKSNRIVAVGEEANKLTKQAPEFVYYIYPIKGGVISDLEATAYLVNNMLDKVCKKYDTGKPIVVVGVPDGISEVEQKAVTGVFLQSGAREVNLISESMASAIGLGLDILGPNGNAIVNIGAGTTEVSIISYGGIIASSCIKIGSDTMIEEVIAYLKKVENIVVNEDVAEKLLMNLGSAQNQVSEIKETITARSISTGLPREIEISSKGIEIAIYDTVSRIVEEIVDVLSCTPPEISRDLMNNGIHLCGGGAALKNLDNLVAKKTGINTFIAERPDEVTALGISKVIDYFDKYQVVLNKGLANSNFNVVL